MLRSGRWHTIDALDLPAQLSVPQATADLIRLSLPWASVVYIDKHSNKAVMVSGKLLSLAIVQVRLYASTVGPPALWFTYLVCVCCPWAAMVLVVGAEWRWSCGTDPRRPNGPVVV